jgi:hypothetical protein
MRRDMESACRIFPDIHFDIQHSLYASLFATGPSGLMAALHAS